MGVSQSTAQVISVGSYAINFATQMYGMQSKPNMLDIHDRRMAAFSPYAYGIPLFFTGQQVVQILWMRSLFKPATPAARAAQLEYAPIFALGNICIATWLMFWNADKLDTSMVFVTINSAIQLYHVMFRLPPKTPQTALTHWNAKTFAGIGLCDFVHNGSAAFFTGVPPNSLVKIVTPIVALLGYAASDSIMAGCLAYDFAILGIQQQGNWGYLLGGLGLVGGAISYMKAQAGR